MLDDKKVIAVIPARGGSKRLPRKNILPLGGKPLIGWTIEAAQNSAYVDDILISTDDQEIADVARQFGITIPELRPEELSTDTATTQSVLFYTLEKYGKDADIVVLLQPTSPFRSSDHIDQAIEYLVEKSAFSVVSVTPCEHPPQWANTLPDNGSMKDFLRFGRGKRSQDLGEAFRLNGAIYVYDICRLLAIGEMAYREDTYAYKMPNEASIDIDNQIDFDMAEFFLQRYWISK
ncbi:acylneuraminate cytidylyltransferase family protein [Vibrio antiquarius]|uniref:acylneuraminate cytidylyltransferase family protein n=1 Tax=Vibrio TaxID=662 RepID=UPI001F2B4D39|nr:MULTISPECIES: acylneuraminate cytidylyltransferase family protein [Vibrio]MCF7372065.1 acylneuraminate cytidylyltransferase family protein [Vibrio sp. J2-3(2022)]MCR9939021.1 acylneuraminate cytidylyltransferase family protein [Vibrio antiquarius]